MEYITAHTILKARPLRITYFILELNHLLDTGEELSFEDAKHAAQGDLISFLKNKYPNAIDLSLFEPNDETTIAINTIVNDIAIVLSGKERRKLGIEHNGICLLIAYAVEALQRLNHKPNL